jgi:hypothetical protein
MYGHGRQTSTSALQSASCEIVTKHARRPAGDLRTKAIVRRGLIARRAHRREAVFISQNPPAACQPEGRRCAMMLLTWVWPLTHAIRWRAHPEEQKPRRALALGRRPAASTRIHKRAVRSDGTESRRPRATGSGRDQSADRLNSGECVRRNVSVGTALSAWTNASAAPLSGRRSHPGLRVRPAAGPALRCATVGATCLHRRVG